MKIAVFPGSFAPFTIGHADIVRRGLELFDRIVVAVGYNAQKGAAQHTAATAPAAAPAQHAAATVPAVLTAGVSDSAAEQRVAAIARIYKDEPRVKVVSYSCLTADLAAQEGARFLLRGVRSVKDFEYERDLAAVNADLTRMEEQGSLETVLLIADPRYAHISSSLVRELQAYGRDVSPYLP